MTNCKNCGAPLDGCKCKYCGTRYDIPNVESNTIYAKGEPVSQDIAYLQRQLLESTCQANYECQRLMMYQNIINSCNTSPAFIGTAGTVMVLTDKCYPVTGNWPLV